MLWLLPTYYIHDTHPLALFPFKLALMPTPQQERRDRLKNDYSQMNNIQQGSLLDWKPLKGQPPFVEKYELTVSVKTIVGPEPSYRETNRIHLILPPGYPSQGTAPRAEMKSDPPPYHPNWYSSGRWCHGSWTISEGLGEFTIRMIRTLKYHSGITDPGDAANSAAARWYRKRQNSDLFPCDEQTLPDPTDDSLNIKSESKNTGFDIISRDM